MFSKARRFDEAKNQTKDPKKCENDVIKGKPKSVSTIPIKSKPTTTPSVPPSSLKSNADTQSQCSSTRSLKTFATPKPLKSLTKGPSSLKKPLSSFSLCKKAVEKENKPTENKVTEDILKAQEAEIRNKDSTIAEYSKQLEELKNEIAKLRKQLKKTRSSSNSDHDNLEKQLSQININEQDVCESDKIINDLKIVIGALEQECNNLEQEVSSKQVELSSLEEIITIRDSLCKDLQDKLTYVEASLEETRQRLEMVKGHHALALEANESIRREYKAELETIKLKLEEEKQSIVNKCKADQEATKTKYVNQIEIMRNQLIKENKEEVGILQQEIIMKDSEMKAKLEQIEEATNEKLKLCEIQFEERFRNIQEHWSMQEDKLQTLEKEANELKYSLSMAKEQKLVLQQEISSLMSKNDALVSEKASLHQELDELKEESKKRYIEFDNEINRLTVEVDTAMKEKHKYEMSLNVTRDIVQVLTMRLRDSDSELEHLEQTVQSMTKAKEELENELANYRTSHNNTIMECNEYKEALVNILKSKAALTKEHTRIMEHNVSLIESLQNVEKEAYRELGSIKNELIEDVEMIKMESKTQIQMLRDEVEKKRLLCELATEHAGQATAAAEQSRQLLAQAANEIARLEGDNQTLTHQIHDQQSLVVELSLLRQENEELAMTVAKQNSIIEKLKKDVEQTLFKPKSPSVHRKNHKLGKENAQIVVSPLRERNH